MDQDLLVLGVVQTEKTHSPCPRKLKSNICIGLGLVRVRVFILKLLLLQDSKTPPIVGTEKP